MTQNSKPVALVTGTSSGIGAAAAARLAEAGFRVFGTRRQAGAVDPDSRYRTFALDVTSDESVRKAIEQVMGEAGRIDVLVNNAGRGITGAAEESSIKQSFELFDANLFGVMRLCRAVLPIMRSQQAGRIINVGSILGLVPSPYQSIYASTKHALEGYSESLDHEVRNFGVRVSVVEPGLTNTRFGDNVGAPDEPLDVYEKTRGAFAQAIIELMPKGDHPELVASVIVTAATARKPKLRYTAGKQAGRAAVLRRLLPASMFDLGLRKQRKLDRSSTD